MIIKEVLFEYLGCGLMSIIGKLSAVVFPDREEELWLISERGTDARDNGYFFYKYLREKHPEINCAYVIDYNSADYKKVANIGRTIQYRSFAHYRNLFLAKYLVSSHIMGFTPCPGFFVGMDKRMNILKGKKIFLQHGIIKDNIEGLKYPNTKVDLFICGAKPEYEYICSEYHYPLGVVKYTGLARYDTLNDCCTNKEILLMPTWRKWINSCTNEEFVESDYFLHYQSLISNNEMNDLLEKNGYKMIFYPHYEMQKFIGNFKAGKSVVIAKKSEYDVQDLLKRCEMLITDYSSVYFDVAYMRKPIVFYQFDKDKFFDCHYARGYIEEEKMGHVETSEEDVIRRVSLYLSNRVIPDDVNSYREAFFQYHDSNNCDRIFKEVQRL